MTLLELIQTALAGLLANKTRTGLTMLGIVIGIASVITLLAIGQGSQDSIKQSVSNLGSNLLTISAGSQRTGLVQGGAGTATSLTLADVTAIQDYAKSGNITGVSPEFSRNTQVVAGSNNTNVSITGAVPDYATVHNYQIQSGSFITSDQNTSRAKVAVIGPDTATNLFGENSSPVGQEIKINKIVFKVIGVTVAKGSSGFQNPDDVIMVPLITAQKTVFGQDNLRSIVVQVKNAETMTQVQDDLTSLLLTKHKITDPAKADFTIRNSADTLSTLSSVTSIFTTLLAGIASISLLVGGIGIMNIMIVTVTERTREIGLRKAVGAQNNAILSQFLVEAIVMTTLGGIIGVTLGFAISFGLQTFANLSVSVSWTSVLLSTGVSVLVGLIFGIYPAMQAAKLSPIDALKYE